MKGSKTRLEIMLREAAIEGIVDCPYCGYGSLEPDYDTCPECGRSNPLRRMGLI